MIVWHGIFHIRLQSMEEHEVVFRSLDGMTVSIAGRTSVVKVSNNFGATFMHPALGISDAAASSQG